MKMPIQINMFVRPTQKYSLPPFPAELSRSLFFSMLKDSDIISKLHDIPNIRPYSLKPLFPFGNKKKTIKQGQWVVDESETLVLGIGVFDSEIEDDILRIIIDSIGEPIRVGKFLFNVDQIEVTKKGKFEEFFPEKLASLIGISFVTPTLLSGETNQALFPDPLRVFGNLLRMWNMFAEEDTKIDSDSFLDWVKEMVYVRHYALKTHEVPIKQAKIVGFKGRVAYVIRDSASEEAEQLIALLRFGIISNIGVKRTYGLGVIKPKDLTHKQPIKI